MSADNKFFSASIVLNVLSKKNDRPSSKTCASERKKILNPELTAVGVFIVERSPFVGY